MSLFWLVYQSPDGATSVVMQESTSKIHARLLTALAGLDSGKMIEAIELPPDARAPKDMLGRRLSSDEAGKLLDKWDGRRKAGRKTKMRRRA